MMDKLLSLHDVEYIANHGTISPMGLSYGFTVDGESQIKVEVFQEDWPEDCLINPGVTIGERYRRIWKFTPNPTETPIETAFYDIVGKKADEPFETMGMGNG